MTQPRDWETLLRFGQQAHLDGRSDDAIDLLEGALRLQKKSAQLYLSLGVVLNARGRHSDAIPHLRRALALKPDLAPAHALLGDALKRAGRLPEAVESLGRAARLEARSAPIRISLGVALRYAGRAQESAVALREAIRLAPESAAAHLHLGVTLRDLDAWDEALAMHRRAVELDPAEAGCHINLAWTLLTTGAFEQAWPEYEWRVRAYQGRDYLAYPGAPGQTFPRPSSLLPIDLAGKRLLLVREQGLGDQLFFLRYAPLARARGAQLACLPDAKLVPLLSRVAAIDTIADKGARPEDFDLVLLMGDLPLVTGAGQDIPPPLALEAAAERRQAMRERLAQAGPPPYLGVTWRAGSAGVKEWEVPLAKRIDPAAFARALAGWPGSVISLQRHPEQGEVGRFARALGRPVSDFGDLNESLEDMLALLAEIDEYAGVSNTNMHLAAGVGRTCRVLVPNPPEYRWMANGDASPWFPGFSIYRQTAAGSWDDALARLTADLRRSA